MQAETNPLRQPRVFTSPWLDTAEAANYLKASPNTLRQWRAKGCGPKYNIVGERLVRYHVDALDAFARG